jgi:hypothetical protein
MIGVDFARVGTMSHARKKPRRCFLYTGPESEAGLDAAVAAGEITEHDAAAVRNFAEFLRQRALPKPPSPPSP